MSSESVEMYLVTIAMLGEESQSGPIPLSRLAEELSVQSVSANQMIRKLDEKGLVNYLPYKGVQLTDEGRKTANHILRHRRLWEVFLVEHLKLSPGEAEELACHIEHDTTLKVSERLATFLEEPGISPSGKVIPPGNGENFLPQSHRLSEMKAGQTAEIVALQVDDVSAGYLQNEGVDVGVNVFIEAISSSGVFLVRVKNKKLSISKDVSENIKVDIQEMSQSYVA